MIKIISEERSTTKNRALWNLDMRIGIHTGKIVGGIIGTKVVRYDIFGQDVLIANKMESNGAAGSVVISDSTYKLILKNNFVADTFYFTEHREVEIGVIGKKIMAYKVEQIDAEADDSSEEYSEEEQNLDGVDSSMTGDENGSIDAFHENTSYGNQVEKKSTGTLNSNEPTQYNWSSLNAAKT